MKDNGFMSKCINCKHFKQTSQINFLISGFCNWSPTEPLPEWLNPYLTSTDYYGPKREVGKSPPYTYNNCDSFEAADSDVIAKRYSDT